MSEPDKSGLVTYEHCHEISTKILNSLDEVKREMKTMNGNVDRVCGDMYGAVEHGQPRGGLVHIVQGIDRKVDDTGKKVDKLSNKMDGRHELGSKERAAIVVALVGGVFSLVIQLIRTFGGGG